MDPTQNQNNSTPAGDVSMGTPAPVADPMTVPASTPTVDPTAPVVEPTPAVETPDVPPMGEQPKVEETPGGTTPPPMPTPTV